jgi:cell division septum initiation protein DivIVA
VTGFDELSYGRSIFDKSPHGGFRTVWRGFDKRRVEKHIRHLESLIAVLEGQLATRLHVDREGRKELSEVIAVLTSRSSPLESYDGLGSRIEQLLRIAEQQAADLISAAETEAAEIIENARTGARSQE